MLKLICILAVSLLLPGTLLSAQKSTVMPVYELSTSFDIPASRLTGIAALSVQAGETLELDAGGLLIKKVALNDHDLEHALTDGKLTVRIPAQGSLKIDYEAQFRKADQTRSENSRVINNTIDSSGILLTGTWYPRLKDPVRYRLRTVLPNGYEALSEAEQIQKSATDGGVEFLFRFDRPLKGITLIASNRYEVFTDRVNGTEVFAYYFPEDRALAKAFIEQAKKHIARYEAMLAEYPFARFSIAESLHAGGHALPTLAIIEQNVLRLPFIAEASLGHEILHQWFGNGISVDGEKGDWAEGLTTYLADHLTEEQAGRGAEYRKKLLLDYFSFVTPQNEITLREFTRGTDPASRAVGSGKGAMVFHMLKQRLGEETFMKGIRRFLSGTGRPAATWDDIRTALEAQSGTDLSAYFQQWLDGKGLPELTAQNPAVKRSGSQFEVSLSLEQQGKPYALELPAVISLGTGGSKKEMLKLDAGEKKAVTILTENEPRMVLLDGGYDVARKLTPAETPPVINTLLGDPAPVVVLPLSSKEVYAPVIAHLKARGGREKEAAGLPHDVIASSSLVVLGNDNPVVDRLFGRVEALPGEFTLISRKNPWNRDKVIIVVSAASPVGAEAAITKVALYGSFSSLAFDQDGNIMLEKREGSQHGIQMELREPAPAIDLSALKTLDDVIRDAAEKKIIYVGEYHDQHAHHAVQLQVIKSLSEGQKKVAIGMEMFQRPFQKALDDYIAGDIGEREFLKKTEYFSRWVFDYNLYKPILDYARERKIPVVALNLKREIVDKVSKTGLDSLSDEERKDVPPQMDFSDDAYRERLRAVFAQHRGQNEKNFDNFYQSQILWDETMAMSIDEFMRKNPEHTMVVIAGGGHLSYGSGIPKRSFRRNGLPYSIILNDSPADKGIADALILPPALEGVAAPKLMAMLKMENDRVVVADLPEESISKKAGVRVGDVIESLDNEKVLTVEDIKLQLFYKKQGEILKVKVLRKRFFGSDQEVEIAVKL
jgi:uncharacterized iron-regulated protein